MFWFRRTFFMHIVLYALYNTDNVINLRCTCYLWLYSVIETKAIASIRTERLERTSKLYREHVNWVTDFICFGKAALVVCPFNSEDNYIQKWQLKKCVWLTVSTIDTEGELHQYKHNKVLGSPNAGLHQSDWLVRVKWLWLLIKVC